MGELLANGSHLCEDDKQQLEVLETLYKTELMYELTISERLQAVAANLIMRQQLNFEEEPTALTPVFETVQHKLKKYQRRHVLTEDVLNAAEIPQSTGTLALT